MLHSAADNRAGRQRPFVSENGRVYADVLVLYSWGVSGASQVCDLRPVSSVISQLLLTRAIIKCPAQHYLRECAPPAQTFDVSACRVASRLSLRSALRYTSLEIESAEARVQRACLIDAEVEKERLVCCCPDAQTTNTYNWAYSISAFISRRCASFWAVPYLLLWMHELPILFLNSTVLYKHIVIYILYYCWCGKSLSPLFWVLLSEREIERKIGPPAAGWRE